MGNVPLVSEEDVQALLAEDGVVVIDFTATWCGPCRKISPLMDQLADEFGTQAKIVKMDVDQCKATAKAHGIRSIPAVLFFKGGEVVDRQIGVAAYEVFKATLQRHL